MYCLHIYSNINPVFAKMPKKSTYDYLSYIILLPSLFVLHYIITVSLLFIQRVKCQILIWRLCFINLRIYAKNGMTHFEQY